MKDVCTKVKHLLQLSLKKKNLCEIESCIILKRNNIYFNYKKLLSINIFLKILGSPKLILLHLFTDVFYNEF